MTILVADIDDFSMNSTTSTNKYLKNADGDFVCPHCKVVKKKQNTMHYHIKRQHEQNFPYECKQCEDSPKFLQKSSYLHHLATNHPENPHPSEKDKNQYATVQFSCPSCTHTTHTKSNIAIHFVRTHCSWIPPYAKEEACSNCKKEFRSSSAYLYHAFTCYKEKAPANYANMLSLIK